MKITALYCRISQEDALNGDSQSIESQKLMMTQYVEKYNLPNPKFYVDDGITGTRFDRESFMQMISDVESGKISTVICKDLSRFGRGHWEVGQYVLDIFPRYDVRFLAITDNVDSWIPESLDFMPFRNVFNEFYAKDTSRKIRAQKRAAALAGRRVGGVPVYGYRKSTTDPKKWVVDEDSANVVREVYDLYIKGHSMMGITKILNEKGYLTPSERQQAEGIRNYTPPKQVTHRAWSHTSVQKMLDNLEYTGCTVSLRVTSRSHRDRRAVLKPEEEWVITPNTQEAIISAELFETVKKLRQNGKRRERKKYPPKPLDELVFCATCGYRLYTVSNNQRLQAYDCGQHRKSKVRENTGSCCSHFVPKLYLETHVLDYLRRVIAFAKESDFIKDVERQMQNQLEADTASMAKELKNAQARIAEIDKTIRLLYDDRRNGILPPERFVQFLTEHEAEQKTLVEKADKLKSKMDTAKENASKPKRFMELVRRYTDATELTHELATALIDKVFVGKLELENGVRSQTVNIHLNIIGNLTITEK